MKPKRNREVISGIVHILKVGCRWRDCPEVYGPHTTIYNRFNRWSKSGVWQTMLEALVDPGSTAAQSIDGTVRARAKDSGMSNSVDTFEPGTVALVHEPMGIRLSRRQGWLAVGMLR